MGANPKTTAFLKECLADALILLLESKPIEKITIPEIAGLAGVGRTTYFRNFKSKDEMLSFKLLVLWDRWVEEHQVRTQRRYSADNALTFFQFNYSIRALLVLMYRRGLQSSLYRAFSLYWMPPDDTDLKEYYISSAYSYGIFGILDAWIVRGFSESPEQMAEVVREI